MNLLWRRETRLVLAEGVVSFDRRTLHGDECEQWLYDGPSIRRAVYLDGYGGTDVIAELGNVAELLEAFPGKPTRFAFRLTNLACGQDYWGEWWAENEIELRPI